VTGARPGLHPVAGRKTDPLDRRREFEATHPGIRVVPPARLNDPWQAIRQGQARPVASAWQLEGLMDNLDALHLPAEDRSGLPAVSA
jgi:hypothetical protein